MPEEAFEVRRMKERQESTVEERQAVALETIADMLPQFLNRLSVMNAHLNNIAAEAKTIAHNRK